MYICIYICIYVYIQSWPKVFDHLRYLPLCISDDTVAYRNCKIIVIYNKTFKKPLKINSLNLIEYFVCCPFAANTALIRDGIDLASLVQKAGVTSFTQTSFIASAKLASDVGFLWETFSFIILHMFSMGFRSGLEPGHGPKTSTL